MGFSRDAIRAEADKTFKGLEIDDAPGGTVTLRNALLLTDSEREAHTELADRLQAIQEDEEATINDLRGVLIEMAEVLADRKGVIGGYLEEFNSAELLAVYSLWAKETQAVESKSAGRRTK